MTGSGLRHGYRKARDGEREQLRERLARPAGFPLSRRVRRPLVLLAGATAAVVLLTPWAVPESSASAVARLVGLFVLLGSAVVLSLAVRTISELPDDVLDERAQRVRDRAYRSAHRVALIPFAIGAAALWAAAERGTVGLTPPRAQALGLLVLCYQFLPVAVLAWTEPDPVAGDPLDHTDSLPARRDGLRVYLPRALLSGLLFFATMVGFAAVMDGWSPADDLLRTAITASLFTVFMLFATRWTRHRL